MYMRQTNSFSAKPTIVLPPSYSGNLYSDRDYDYSSGEGLNSIAKNDEIFSSRRKGYTQRQRMPIIPEEEQEEEQNLTLEEEATDTEPKERQEESEEVFLKREEREEKHEKGIFSLIKGIGSKFGSDDILIVALILLLLDSGEDRDTLLILGLIMLLL